MNFALLFFMVVVMVNCYIGIGNTEKTDKKNGWDTACRYTVNGSHPVYLVRQHRQVPYQHPCKSYLCTKRGQLFVFTCDHHPTIKCKKHSNGKYPNCCPDLPLCTAQAQGTKNSSLSSLEQD
uniref:Putative secreted protein n=1 Tax=Amblyomma triste TaxID=251400 RepID=A0A023G4F3_AMBTT